MHITIVSVGKIKESFWNEAIQEYLKRMQPYAKLSFVEIDNKAFKDNENSEVIKKQEAELILEKLEKTSGIIIALDEHEKEYTSPEFAEFLKNKTMYGDSLTFIIGGPKGLHESVKKASHQLLSLSRMTFPHNIAKVVFIEQLYRALTILQGKEYHY